MSVASEAVADEVGALRVSTGLTCACVAVVGLVLLADSHGLVGHWVSAASVAGAVDLKVLVASASISTVVTGFSEGLASSVLHAIVVTSAVDSIVRDHGASSLLAGESGASIGRRYALTHGDHASVVLTSTRPVCTTDGTRFGALTSVTTSWKGLTNSVGDAILRASAGPGRAGDLSILVADACIASITGGE